MLGYDEGEWTDFHTLLLVPWFSRVWVAQEIGLSRNAVFHCRDASCTRQKLDRFLNEADSAKPEKSFGRTCCTSLASLH
jgi:hypothetical protein